MVSGAMPPQTLSETTYFQSYSQYSSMVEKPFANFNVNTFAFNHNLITYQVERFLTSLSITELCQLYLISSNQN